MEVYRKVREEGRWLCSPLGSSRVLGSAGDGGKTHISTPAPLQDCSSYSDHKEQSLPCRDPLAHLEEHTVSHTGLVYSGHTSILLSHTPVQMTLLPGAGVPKMPQMASLRKEWFQGVHGICTSGWCLQIPLGCSKTTSTPYLEKKTKQNKNPFFLRFLPFCYGGVGAWMIPFSPQKSDCFSKCSSGQNRQSLPVQPNTRRTWVQQVASLSCLTSLTSLSSALLCVVIQQHKFFM